LRWIVALTVALTFAEAKPTRASETHLLRGSAGAMVEQNRIAREHGLSFLLSPTQVRRAVSNGDLVELQGNADYEVSPLVGHPYVVPPVLTFVERFSAEYRRACGQRLVVTSAVRPVSQQPGNAHALSVHPAGMAVDVRVSDRPSCRQWLETALVVLGKRGVLNGIRERNPPHYHIAVYPSAYLAYVEEQLAEERAAFLASRVVEVEIAPDWESPAPTTQAVLAGAREDRQSGQGAIRGIVPLTVTMLTGLVGGGLVLGVRPPSARLLTGWLARLGRARPRRRNPMALAPRAEES
jgi:hypothetical protein